MNCILKMPVRVYLEFLRRCELTSREYAVLKSSHVEPILPGDYNVETLCDVNDADLLLDRAKQLSPQAIPYIEQALTSVRHLWLCSEGSYFSPRQPALRIPDCSMFWFRSLKNRRVIPSKLFL